MFSKRYVSKTKIVDRIYNLLNRFPQSPFSLKFKLGYTNYMVISFVSQELWNKGNYFLLRQKVSTAYDQTYL